MIADLKPYPVLKDSGVPWLREVPEHWEVLPNRALFTEVKERDHPEEQMLSVTIRKGVIRQQAFLADSSKKDSSNQDRSAYKLVRPGDIAYNKMRAWQGAVGVSEYRGIVSPAYVVQRPYPNVNSRYVHHLLRTPAFAKEAERWSYGITSDMWSLRPEHFKMIYGCLPPLPEQAAIVRFLDHYDRKIRRYIRAKQKLVKLLEEQKLAIIHRAVTRGLDPNVRLKPSGVEWLGEVPEHWEVAALRHRYSQGLGKMLDVKRITGSHSLPYLRNTDVQWDRINVVDLPTMDIPEAEYSRYTVLHGDLLVCEGGEVGRCAIWSGELGLCGFQKALHRLRPVHPARDVPRFMYYALRAAAKANAFSDGHVSTIAHLTGDKLRAHGFPFPPSAEQASIVTFLDSVLKQIDQAAAATFGQISLLREYRTRLIADVVTGKLDVREAAACLPDEFEEPEPLDEADTLTDTDEDEADDLDGAPEEAGA
jgi:type I restriction enzyme, S subunit